MNPVGQSPTTHHSQNTEDTAISSAPEISSPIPQSDRAEDIQRPSTPENKDVSQACNVTSTSPMRSTSTLHDTGDSPRQRLKFGAPRKTKDDHLEGLSRDRRRSFLERMPGPRSSFSGSERIPSLYRSTSSQNPYEGQSYVTSAGGSPFDNDLYGHRPSLSTFRAMEEAKLGQSRQSTMRRQVISRLPRSMQDFILNEESTVRLGLIILLVMCASIGLTTMYFITRHPYTV